MTPRDYPDEWEDLNRELQNYQLSAESPEWTTKRAENEKNRQHMNGYHWVNKRAGDSTSDRPSIQLTWQQCQMQMAKIFQGHGFKPEVVAESDQVYEDPLIKQAIQKNAQQLNSRSEAEAAAEIRSIILDYYYEKMDMLGTFKEACQMAQWYEEGAYIVDTYDEDGPALSVVHPSDVRYDPEAEDISDVRFICYHTRRTIAYIKEHYPRFAESVEPDGGLQAQPDNRRPYRYRAGGFPDEDQENVTLECWYIRDYDTKNERVDEQVITDPAQLSEYLDEGYEVDEELTEYQPMATEGFSGAVMEQVPVSWTVFMMGDVPKYPGGWKKVYRANQVILNDDEDETSFHIHSANGELPIHHMKYYNAPGQYGSMSLVRQIKPLVNIIDQMMQEGLDNVRTLMPFITLHQGRVSFDAAQRIGSEYPLPVVKMKPEAGVEDIREVFQHHPGAELSQSFMAMVEKLQHLIEDIAGGYDLRSANNLPSDASGKFVEAVETAGNARISEVRENVRQCAKTVAQNILANVLYYETKPQKYRSKRGTQSTYIDVIPAQLTNDEMEADFDIIVGGSNTLPNDPIMRNEHNTQMIATMISQPSKTVAMGMLDNMELDNRESIRQVVESHYDEMAQDSEQQGQDPEAARRYQEGASDVLEQLGKEAAEFHPELSLVISMQLQNAAQGQPVDYALINQLIQSKRQTLIQAQPLPQGAIQ